MSITKAQLRTLRNEMQAALNRAGITDFDLEVGNMRYGATEVDIKVKGKLKGVKSTSDAVFERKVAEYGLKIRSQCGRTLTGYKTSRPKYPFSLTGPKGGMYKCSVEQAKAIFGA